MSGAGARDQQPRAHQQHQQAYFTAWSIRSQPSGTQERQADRQTIQLQGRGKVDHRQNEDVQHRASQIAQFRIPCAQLASGNSGQSYGYARNNSYSNGAAEESSDTMMEDFQIGPQNMQSRLSLSNGNAGGSNGGSSNQLSSDQQQLQQKGFQNSIEQQKNMQGGLEDDNLDDMDTNGLIGVIKIKDGLFICDELGAQDLEFVVANKVTRVINCAGTQLRNFWEAIGVMYLTLNWQDDEKQVLFDAGEKIPEEIYRFMEEAVDKHESVMIQSVRAQNRACFVIATFIMRRYRWSLLKTLEFLNSRRPDLEMRPSFLAQLQQYEGRLYARGIGPKTKRWNELAESDVPELENDELILRNTYMNSQQGPLVDLSPPPGGLPPKQDLLVWRDLAKDRAQQQSLCEENEDATDLVNLVNPAKQLNHYQKPASQLRSKLKNSKLHAAQKRQDQYGAAAASSQMQQNFMNDAAEPKPQVPPRANSANSKSKFLTKTQMGSGQTVSSKGHSQQEVARPVSEQQQVRSSLGRPSQMPGGTSLHTPSPSMLHQQHQQQHSGHQPSTSHIQSSLFYPQPSFQQQKQATLQQKVLSQRPMSHQVREVSPLNGQNLNSRISRPNAGGPGAAGMTSSHGRSGHSGHGPSGYVPYEPKKREMTQKIAPKMPLPMTQDLTNLPLPSGGHQEQPAAEKPTNQPVKSFQNSHSSHSAANQQNEAPGKQLAERVKPSGSNISYHQTKTTTAGSHSRLGGSGASSQMANRGISPSFQSKTGDFGMRNRSTLNSSFKRSAMTAHPPAHPAHNGVSMAGASQGNDGQTSSLRPGSAPKMRTQTPNGDATASSSLVLRSQPSTQSTAGGLNSSMSLSKQMEGNGSHATSSKNMLNSFRNGPIKVIGSASHLSSANNSGQSSHAHKPRVSSSKFVSSSNQQSMVGGRPASAPNKRPPSPNTSGTGHHNSGSAGSSSTTGQNRVKYTKGVGSASGLQGSKSGVASASHQSGAQGGPNQLRQGLNPMLRGYSPSKHRWKIASTATSGAAARHSANHHHGHSVGSGGHSHAGGSNFGGTNPNVYTRSTKHTPSHATKA